MLLAIILLLAGLALLIIGAEGLVRGASGLARTLGVSELVIGLTVVAFGTSTPELAVNLSAALTDNGDLAFGNVVGSNICNIGLILGISALIRPLTTHIAVIQREIPMMLLATAAMIAMSLDRLLDAGESAVISRTDGLVMLLFFGVFLYYLTAESLGQRTDNLEQTKDEAKASVGKSIGLTMVGLVALVIGGKLAVDAAAEIAIGLGIAEVVIGLFLLAVGTSLPELAVSATAAWRGKTDIAVGNIVGSNIFNILFIVGVSATIRPLAIPVGGMLDLIVMALFAAVLLPIAMTHRGTIVRAEGVVLLVGYAGYIAWRAVMQ
jgi:cation:H+ antiporter